MTGLDSAIRNAIDRAGAEDAAARRRIYDTARRAFEKGIANHPDLDTEAAAEQRRRFEAIVDDIEADKTGASGCSNAPHAHDDVAPPREEVEAGAEPQPGHVPDVSHTPGNRSAGSVPFPDVAAERAAPTASRKSADAEAPEVAVVTDEAGRAVDADVPTIEREARPDAARVTEAPATADEDTGRKRGKVGGGKKREKKRGKRRAGARILSALFLLVSLLVFVAIGLWLLDATGLVDEAETAGSGPNSFAKFDSSGNGVPDLVTGDGFGNAWTPIFVPGGKASGPLTTGATAQVKPIDSERGKAARLTSTTAGADGDIRITVPAPVLKQMAGTTATIALNMRAVAGETTHIAIECDFGAMGGCNRRRFEVNPEMTDVVIRIDEQKAAATGKPGTLLINTDIDGKGRSVDLFAVGLRNGE